MESRIMIEEATDYVKSYGLEGVTLTETGARVAKRILSMRLDWTPAHGKMLERIEAGERALPFKLGRLVSHTRLGLAVELLRKLNRKHLKNQKTAARRKAAKARAKARAAV